MPLTTLHQVDSLEHWDTVRRVRRKTAVIAFAVGVAATLLMAWIGAWWGRTVHISDDYNYGRSFRDTVDCEVLAEAVYHHDIFTLTSDRTFDGWAPRAEQNFFRGCDGQPPMGGGGGD